LLTTADQKVLKALLRAVLHPTLADANIVSQLFELVRNKMPTTVMGKWINW